MGYFDKEEDLAAEVVADLEAQGWTVYQEVQCGTRADIVATRGPLLWVIECKLSISLELLAQAHDWRGWAHFISIAVEAPKRRGRRRRGSRTAKFVRDTLKAAGIGYLRVGENGVEEFLAPRLNRTISSQLRDRLSEEQRTFAKAGNGRNEFWSPYKQTCRRLAIHVRENAGCSLKEAIDSIQHHYASNSSAISSLRHWLAHGKVAGVRLQYKGRKIQLYPQTETPTTRGLARDVGGT